MPYLLRLMQLRIALALLRYCKEKGFGGTPPKPPVRRCALNPLGSLRVAACVTRQTWSGSLRPRSGLFLVPCSLFLPLQHRLVVAAHHLADAVAGEDGRLHLRLPRGDRPPP